MKGIKIKLPAYSSIVWGLICLFIVVVSIVNYRRYYCFDYMDMDLAAYSQIMWNLAHGSFYSSLLGVNFLGHHAHFILLFLVPAYFFFQSPLLLLFLQSALLSFSAYPIFLIARDEISEQAGLWMVIIYLLYPAMGYTLFYEFHVPVFATVFLSFMLYFFIKGRFSLFSLFVFLSLCCQENISLLIMPMGVFALFKKRSAKWVIMPMAAGALWFFIVVGKLMPYFNKNTVEFVGIYSQFGNSLPEIFSHLITRPLQTAKFIFMPQKIKYLMQLFGPLSFLSVFDSHILVAGLIFLQHLLSSRSAECMIEYHYDAEMIPFIFVSGIYGLKKLLNIEVLKKHVRKEIIGVFLITISLTCAVSFGPFVDIVFNSRRTRADVWDKQKARLISMIPDTASVVATFEFLPMLSQRKKLYSFHHVAHGFYTLSRKPYRLPAGVEYALLDFDDPIGVNAFFKRGRSEINISDFFRYNKWGIVDILNNFALLKNNYPGDLRFFDVVDKMPAVYKKLNIVFLGELLFMGYNIGEARDIPGGKKIPVAFYFNTLKKINRDYRMVLEIYKKPNILKFKTVRPLCYRIFPTYLWQEGKVIRDNYFLFIPEELGNKSFLVNVKFIDASSGETVAFFSAKEADSSKPVESITILNE